MREQFDDIYEDEDSGIIPIFPDEDEYEPSYASDSDNSGEDDETPVKLTFGHIERAAKQAVNQMAAEDSYESDYDDDDDDGEVVSLSFAKAEKKEKEFIFMPFLNIEENDDDDDDEDGEEISLSFAKTEKKEKDFIFMPFLNIEENDDDDDGNKRSEEDDDDLVIIPLPDADETYNNLFQKTEDEDEDGISVVGGDIAPVPKKKKKSSSGPKKPSSSLGSSKKHPASRSANASRSGSAKPRQGQKQGQKKPAGYGQQSSSKKLSHNQQFQRAMRNVNPEILEAVKHDPVQKAALEQAIRIALVQYAAQEAVAKSNGRIGLDMLAYQKPSSKSGKRPPSGKKSGGKKKPNSQRSRMAGSSMSRSMRPRSASSSGTRSVHPLDLTPVELGAGSSGHNKQPDMSASNQNAQQLLQQQQAAQQAQQAQQAQPQTAQQTQQPVQHQNRHITPNSPAAIRAAMKAGIDINNSGSQSAAAKPSTAPLTPQQRAQAQANAAAAANRSGCLVGIIAVFVVFFVAMIAFFIIPVARQREQYNAAINSMSEGNYASALRTLEDIADYEDAEELIKECRYNLGIQYQTKGDYEAAIKQFDKVLTYNDSSSKIVECKYMQGKNEFSSGNYRAAYELFREIASYSDAADLAREANYSYITSVYDSAEDKYAAGDIEGALSDYIKALSAYDNIDGFKDYLDSHSRWQIMQYKCATVMYEAGENGASLQFEQAAKLFLELGDYNDSALKFALTQYELIKLDKVETFMLSDFVYGMNALNAAKPAGYEQMLASPAYTGAKLVGTWTSGDYSFTITAGEDMDTLTFELPGDWRDTDVIVKFSGSSALITRDGEELEVMKVNAFTPADSAAPTGAEIFCTDSGETLTFTKG